MEAQLTIAAIAGSAIVLLSFLRWRVAVKAAFVMVLVEGAIRKWFLPGQQELVYFLKDMLLAGAYFRFFLFPDLDLRTRRLTSPLLLLITLCAIVSISAFNPNIGSFLLALYGLKIYFYYIPLAFMMPYLFRNESELIRGLTRYALFATPICLLGIAQFAAPSVSILNVYAETTEDTIITTFGAGDKARITGTFSYLTGHTTFLVFFFALHLALMTAKQPRHLWFWLLANIPLLIANALMGGSRASIASIAIVGLGFAVMSALGKRGKKLQGIRVVALSAILAGLVSLSFFGEALDQWQMRTRSASDTFWERIYEQPMTAIAGALESGGGFGYGIGMTHPVMFRLRSILNLPPPQHEPPLFDTEPGRVMAELGLAGFLAWYALRLLVLKQSYSSYTLSRPGDLQPLLLAALLVQTPFFLMSMVLNHTANFLIWACYGLSLIPWLRTIAGTRRSPARMAPQGSSQQIQS